VILPADEGYVLSVVLARCPELSLADLDDEITGDAGE
jgi:hypothetical protein